MPRKLAVFLGLSAVPLAAAGLLVAIFALHAPSAMEGLARAAVEAHQHPEGRTP